MRNHKLIRLFVDTDLPGTGPTVLSDAQSHYLLNVMRLKVGAELALFNGRDGEWLAVISDAKKRAVTIKVGIQSKPQTYTPDLWLAFAPVKKARLDFIAQKATELGIDTLIPMITDRTAVDRVKESRLYANAVEAAEQCERLSVPTVSKVIKLEALLQNWPQNRRIMFCDEQLSGDNAYQALVKSGQSGDLGQGNDEKWAILIGPEGGFTDNERRQIIALPGTVTVSLGPRVLRADTAAIVAISLWQSALGDWV